MTYVGGVSGGILPVVGKLSFFFFDTFIALGRRAPGTPTITKHFGGSCGSRGLSGYKLDKLSETNDGLEAIEPGGRLLDELRTVEIRRGR
jgi:hypothetical protein